ncbi:hypothetical protein [Neorhizobium sp. NCHU2750]|uniref:hypothetical protein n=1 Tax=Neorhizobium sp. NCHU2750 TaxID=1825976 RepID=UPI000EB745B3|nr:hypothetical protein NCHU2750_54600 [Neorhizobium sp. NCHU2750]
MNISRAGFIETRGCLPLAICRPQGKLTPRPVQICILIAAPLPPPLFAAGGIMPAICGKEIGTAALRPKEK